MATHSSVLAWRIPGTAEPGGLSSMGSHSQTQLTRLSSSSSSIRLEVSNLRGISFLNRQYVQRTHITKETTVYMYNPRSQVSNQKLVEGI